MKQGEPFKHFSVLLSEGEEDARQTGKPTRQRKEKRAELDSRKERRATNAKEERGQFVDGAKRLANRAGRGVREVWGVSYRGASHAAKTGAHSAVGAYEKITKTRKGSSRTSGAAQTENRTETSHERGARAKSASGKMVKNALRRAKDASFLTSETGIRIIAGGVLFSTYIVFAPLGKASSFLGKYFWKLGMRGLRGKHSTNESKEEVKSENKKAA